MHRPLIFSIVAASLALGGCGGGGVGSTPSPTPTPTASNSFPLFAGLSGTTTFTPAFLTDPTCCDPSVRTSGLTLTYDPRADSYTISLDGVTKSYGPSNLQSDARSDSFSFGIFNDSSLTFRTIRSGNVDLTYTKVADWRRYYNPNFTDEVFVLGVATSPSQMPRTGTATYSNLTIESEYDDFFGPNVANQNSTGTFTADFAAGTVATTLDLRTLNSPDTPLITLTGTGTIASGSNLFAGNLGGVSTGPRSAAVSGTFSGAFYGPGAAEMGLVFSAAGGTASQPVSVYGWAAGRK